jgi:site-specific DNA recombinase
MTSNAPQAAHHRTVPSFYLLRGLLFFSCRQAMIGRSAKSHQYYYYMCNRSYKQGKDACSTRAFPKDKLEGLVIDQIKERVLTQEYLEELVKLVNEKLDSAHVVLKDKMDVIDAELSDVKLRLSKLYDALETGKLNLDELAPKIRELRIRQDELSKARVQVEVEIVLQGAEYVDVGAVKSYAQDLGDLLEETGFTKSNTLLRSFIKRIVINGDRATIYYKLPMPPDGKKKQSAGILPIDTPGGAGGIRTRYLLTEKSVVLSEWYRQRKGRRAH